MADFILNYNNYFYLVFTISQKFYAYQSHFEKKQIDILRKWIAWVGGNTNL